ncbi:MAG: DUF3309 domain-containing protein [Terracidiphilus sp.]
MTCRCELFCHSIRKWDVESRGRNKDAWNLLIVILVLALLGALPRWPHSRNWGYFPTGGLGLVLLIVIVLLVLGRI